MGTQPTIMSTGILNLLCFILREDLGSVEPHEGMSCVGQSLNLSQCGCQAEADWEFVDM